MSVLKIFYLFWIIPEEYKKVSIQCVFALMEGKTEIMYGRKMLKSPDKLPCEILRRQYLINLCFNPENTMD
ncbi:hypothetical protein HZS_7316 [Henneguya salminicola]|nr:hypothetical protein HZS_7316 [Henneguya salminicola]